MKADVFAHAVAPDADLSSRVCRATVMCAPEVITAEEWDALSLNAIEENPFIARRFVRAGLLAFGQQGLRMIALREETTGTLVGMMPFRTGGVVSLLAGREAQIALNCYQVEGVPLIDRRHVHAALHAFMDLIDGPDLPGRWIFPQIGLDGAFLRALRAVAAERGLLCDAVHRFDRPLLRRLDAGFEAHAETVIGRKRIRDIERNLRRLGEFGSVRFERATEHAHVRLRLDAFLAIENAGWKGAAGTAFLARREHARFARSAFGGSEPAEGATSIDTLLLNGEPIALSVNVRTGKRVFAAKCTYDEAYRKYGPGMVLEYLVIKHFYAHDEGVEMDAATTAPGHVIAGLWNATRPMGTVTLGPATAQTRLALKLHENRHAARETAKRLLRRG